MTNENTTQATETETSKPAGGNRYPFLTKKQIIAMQANDDVVLEHLGILVNRQTEDEREDKVTRYKNRRGLMSSHAVNGTKIFNKVASGEELSETEWAMIREIVSHYGKQLAAFYRAEAIENNPALALESASFFKPQS